MNKLTFKSQFVKATHIIDSIKGNKMKKTSSHIIDYITPRVDRGMSYMDAVLRYCEDNKIDPSTIASKLPKVVKDKIEEEAGRLKLLKS